jgi:hypothetical protein
VPRALKTLAAAGLALAALATPAQAENAQRDIGFLNAERSAFGLPAGITENTEWSQDCAQHNEYERQNGGQLTHEEDSSKPGYTPGGKFAGENSILASGLSWSAAGNPWEDAPIHLVQLFTPSLSEIGIDDSSGFVCATTFPGMNRAQVSSATVTTYPGDGVKGFPTSENASEGPFVPGDFVGVPQGTTAGRELFVYLDVPGQPGPAQVKINSASLEGPDGPVEVRFVDNTTDTIGPYLTGGVLIPVKPLKAGSTYKASVSVAAPGGAMSKSWSYTTAGGSAAGAPKVSKVKALRKAHAVSFKLACPVACAGKATLKVKRHGKNVSLGSKSVSARAGQSKTFKVGINKSGRKLLRKAGTLKATLRVKLGTPAFDVSRKVTLHR